jgi:uncharacterized protein YndB with AHSA1/START domain
MRRTIAVAALICTLGPAWAVAEVADSAANGFTVKIVTTIRATPADVYNRLTHNIGDWWSSEHTFSGDPHNLSIDERPMGCFCEKLPNQGSVRHMEVVFVAPGKTLRMSGAMGPLQALAAAGTLTFALTPASGGTQLEATYAVGGYSPKGWASWAMPVNTMLTEQVTRLKNYIETGNPDVPSEKKHP